MSELMTQSASPVAWDIFDDLKGVLSGPREMDALLRKFFDLTQSDIQEIKAAFLRGEFNRLQRLAHRLISSAHPFGAIEMIAILKEIERLSTSELPQVLREKIKLLDKSFLQTKFLIEQRNSKESGLAENRKGTI